MATYDQLNAESWWRAETVTPEMDWLGDQLCSALSVPRANFGCKGDNSSGHMRGGHRSQAWLLNSRYSTSRTYTVEPGLPSAFVNDLPAFDITPKNNAQMLTICRNLDRVVRAGQLEEVVVWYGNLDNTGPVDGYDNIRNIIATSDHSHDWHCHIQVGRRFTRSRAVMERILAALLGQALPSGDDVQADERNWLVNSYNGIFFGGASMGPPVPAKVNATSSGNAVIDLLQHIRARVDRLEAQPAGQPSDEQMKALGDRLEAAVDARVEAALRRVLGGLDGATPTG